MIASTRTEPSEENQSLATFFNLVYRPSIHMLVITQTFFLNADMPPLVQRTDLEVT